jgi:IMP and pyridine-specific 5'-nucleotidase
MITVCGIFHDLRVSLTDLVIVEHQKVNLQHQSKLKLLVPSIGSFFTRLPLADAFRYQDRIRFISSRRFVPPSFNDVRLILNTAQVMGVTAAGPLDLATFDGDVTLYDDGMSLEPDNPVIQRILGMCSLAVNQVSF